MLSSKYALFLHISHFKSGMAIVFISYFSIIDLV